MKRTGIGEIWNIKKAIAELEDMEKRRFPEYLSFISRFISNGMTVLDVGCGSGGFTNSLAEHLPNVSIIGVDLYEEMVNRAISVASEKGIENVQFLQGDAYSLPVGDDSVDITTFANLVEWLRYPVNALKEQKRVTKPNGMIVSLVGDWGPLKLYPECPHFEQLWNSFTYWNDIEAEFFMDAHCGRKLLQYYTEADLKEIEISGYWSPIKYFPDIAAAYDTLTQCCRIEEPKSFFSKGIEQLLKKGVITLELVEKSKAELDLWRKHPHAIVKYNDAIIAKGTV